MKIKYSFLNKVMIVILGGIFVCEGLNLWFHFGLNHHLYHFFWLVVSFALGLFVGEKLIDREDDVFYET